MAHNRGARDDRVGALTAYYSEGPWRIQQRITVADMLFFPIIPRYPDCFTVNIRFASGHTTMKSVPYESPEHSTEELDDGHAERYYNESLHLQKEAAEYIRDTAEIIREEFPSPDKSTLEERQYGGITSAGGRKGPVFSLTLKRVELDPNRSSEPVDQPTLVEEDKETRRTERELLPEGAIVLRGDRRRVPPLSGHHLADGCISSPASKTVYRRSCAEIALRDAAGRGQILSPRSSSRGR